MADAAQSDVWTTILFQLGGGGILGFAAGYAFKKLLKLVLLVVGVFVIGLLALEYKGWVSVNYTALANSIERALTGGASAAAGVKSHIIANLPFAGAFLAGFALGFKAG
ncbi:FUN14 domain-containing protein [Stetteria hydrogenophila]